MIRMAQSDDLGGILLLYTHLHKGASMPQMNSNLANAWKEICKNDNHSVIVAEENGKIVSSCTIVIIENLTHESRPFAVIENVVTHEKYRGMGLARQCVEYACELARVRHCYKIMLMSSNDREGAHEFYEKCDFSSTDKKAFVKRLD